MLTITHDNIEITVRPRNGFDVQGAPYMQVLIFRHVAPPNTDVGAIPLHAFAPIEKFTHIVQQTVSVKGLDFEFPTVYSPESVLHNAFDKLLGDIRYLPLFNAWHQAVVTANLAPNDDPQNPTLASENTD